MVRHSSAAKSVGPDVQRKIAKRRERERGRELITVFPMTTVYRFNAARESRAATVHISLFCPVPQYRAAVSHVLTIEFSIDFCTRERPDIMTASKGGGGRRKVDVVREVA